MGGTHFEIEFFQEFLHVPGALSPPDPLPPLSGRCDPWTLVSDYLNVNKLKRSDFIRTNSSPHTSVIFTDDLNNLSFL